MTAKEWVESKFFLIGESHDGFEVCAASGDSAYIPRKDAELAAAAEDSEAHGL